MNPIPGSGGGFPTMHFPGPIWYPPIAGKWIFTLLILFAGATANKFNKKVRGFFLHPVGFFLTALVALRAFQVGFPPATFAILFFLFSLWATQRRQEGFCGEGFLCGSNTMDWVVNNKRWWVERVLKERPVAIQAKDVATYPVNN